jgi:hypothetical protein
VLLVTATLSIYKPWGRVGGLPDTGVALAASASAQQRTSMPIGLRLFLMLIGAIVAAIVIVHLAGGGMGRH